MAYIVFIVFRYYAALGTFLLCISCEYSELLVFYWSEFEMASYS